MRNIELLWHFICKHCGQKWLLSLVRGADYAVLNKELHCPWCGKSGVYVSDEDYR